MNDSVKILPALIFSAFVLLAIKSVGIWFGAQDFLAGAAMASTAAEEESSQELAQSTTEETTTEEATTGEAASDKELTEYKDPKARDERREREDSLFLASPDFMNESEVKVLQSLAARRETLNQRESSLDLREKLLMAAENRVSEKIDQLKAIESRITGMLKTRDEEQKAQIASLVKVYETMKAKDAALIFERLDTDTLLEVAARMKEQKVAAIMAKMSPDSAQDLTVKLLKRREIPEFDGMTGLEDVLDKKG